MVNEARDELHRLIARYGIVTRPEGYVLASGQISPYYFDLKRVLLSHPRALNLVSCILLHEVLALDPPVMVGGMGLGAAPLVIGVSQHGHTWDMPRLNAFLIRGEAKKTHGTEQEIEGEPTGRVVLLDDVLTTGGSLLRAAKIVEDAGATVAHMFVVLDREAGGIQRVRGAGYGVSMIFTQREFSPAGVIHA